MNQLRQVAKRSRTMVIAYHVYDNWRVKRRVGAGQPATSRSGSTHMCKTLSESLAYINQVFDDYLRYSGLCVESLRGLRILEVGPGDNLGVAMKFVGAGARRVICVDKFLTEHDSVQQQHIYRALRGSMTGGEREALDTAVNLDGGVEIDENTLRSIPRSPIEEAPEALRGEAFDLIVSRAVLEHVYDPDMAISAMDQLLAPGGLMLHKIDFRDHGLFTDGGQHPLTLLTIPAALHKLMVYDTGKPNRRLIGYYRQKMEELGYKYRLLITHLVGSSSEILPHADSIPFNTEDAVVACSLAKSIQGHLQPEFRDMPVEDLIVDGIFLVARKERLCSGEEVQ